MALVTVTRAFCLAGLRQEVGAVVDVSDSLAAELVAYGKASRDVLPTPASEAPKRKAKKEEPHEPV
ncbi:MAG: hypothetical protein KBH41_14355 [Azonexus sp.]|nr:hypothetical protein [Azonexus sp.]